jgi:hypothetical protein
MRPRSTSPRPLAAAPGTRRAAALLAGALATTRCVTGASAVPADAAAAPAPAPAPSAQGVGPLLDDTLAGLIYDSIGASLEVDREQADGGEQRTDIGDFDAFRFRVVRLTRGSEDVSATPQLGYDGLEIQVSGWYKRTTMGPHAGDQTRCMSFDALVRLAREGDTWALEHDAPLTITREDPEDCE